LTITDRITIMALARRPTAAELLVGACLVLLGFSARLAAAVKGSGLDGFM
jgi:hypothetical protein